MKKKPVTLDDIALHLGLSQRTVSQALNGREESTAKVGEKTRERIVQAAKQLGYRPNRMARALRTGRGGMLGVLTTHGLQHYSAVRLHMAIEEISRTRYAPYVTYASSYQQNADEVLHSLLDAPVDGVLMLDPPAWFDQTAVDQLRAAGLPVIAIGSEKLKGVGRYWDNRATGFEKMVFHLVEQQCRSLCFLTLTPRQRGTSVKNLLKSYRRAVRKLQAQGQEVTASVHCLGTPDGPSAPDLHVLHRAGYLAMREVIASGTVPDAVLCQADVWAQGAIRACQEAGLRVPHDLAVTGFDNEPSSSAGWLPLTSMSHGITEAVRRAVEELCAIMEGQLPQREHSTLVEGRLVVRRSSLRQ